MSSNDEVGVTFVWEIENFDQTWDGNIKSPVFLSNSLDGTEWYIELYPLGTIDSDYISLNLTRFTQDYGMDRIILDCELSILDEVGVPIIVKEIKNHGFVRGHTCWIKYFVLRDAVFESKRRDFLYVNILTVRCRLWRRLYANTHGEIRFSRTKIERCCFVWTIEQFRRLEPYQREKIYLKKYRSETSILTFELFIGINGKVEIEISPTKPRKIQSSCHISVLDVFGEKVKSKSEWHAFELPMDDGRQSQQVWRFPPFIKKSSLLGNQSMRLPMGILSLRVECYIYTTGANNIGNTHLTPIHNFYVTKNPSSTQKCDKQCMTESEGIISELCNSCKFEKKVYGSETSNGSYGTHFHSGFMHYIQCMYEEGILSDFILRSSNKEFHVHKNILSARSPVFKAMFATAKEKDRDFVDIPDVDADTLQRMLLFVYLNRMDEDMQWESAMDLYFAADKYAIDDLKRASCSLLKARLSATNACEILAHTDLHGDQDLKSFTIDFIVDNDSKVIGSENWKKLLESNIHLTVEIFNELYLKKMKNEGVA